MCPEVCPSIDVVVFKYSVFVFLDYREVLINVIWDHINACDILYPTEMQISNNFENMTENVPVCYEVYI